LVSESLHLDLQSDIAKIKRDVVSASIEMYRSGLVTAVWGNVSARVPGTDLVVCTPSGVEYELIEESKLCVIDLNTEQQVEGDLRPTSELQLHLAMYRFRDDVFGVMHTHSLYASAFAVAHKEIPPIVEDMAQVVGGSVSVARYALPGGTELAQYAVKTLGKKNAVLLANHGVVCVGENVQEALRVSQVVEKSAHIYAVAKSLGSPFLLSLEDVHWLRDKYKTSYGQKPLT
jgi:L-ribulose-5-phosphate 4-epimerase